MNKTKAIWGIIELVFVVIFNLFFFLIGGTEHGASVWISYAFIHFAYFMVIATPLFVKGSALANTGMPVITLSSIYFFVAFVIGITFIFISPESIKPTLLVQICPAGLYIVLLGILMLVNEHSEKAETGRREEIDYVKKATTTVKGYLNEVSDKALKKKIEKLYDELASSPSKSNANVYQIENETLEQIERLGDTLNNTELASDVADTTLSLVKKRNRQLQTHHS